MIRLCCALAGFFRSRVGWALIYYGDLILPDGDKLGDLLAKEAHRRFIVIPRVPQ